MKDITMPNWIDNQIKKSMQITSICMVFTEDDIAYFQTKFDIKDEKDLKQAVWEMINTYMEM